MTQDIKQIIAEMRERVGNPPYRKFVHEEFLNQSDIDMMVFLANNITAILDYVEEVEKDAERYKKYFESCDHKLRKLYSEGRSGEIRHVYGVDGSGTRWSLMITKIVGDIDGTFIEVRIPGVYVERLREALEYFESVMSTIDKEELGDGDTVENILLNYAVYSEARIRARKALEGEG